MDRGSKGADCLAKGDIEERLESALVSGSTDRHNDLSPGGPLPTLLHMTFRTRR